MRSFTRSTKTLFHRLEMPPGSDTVDCCATTLTAPPPASAAAAAAGMRCCQPLRLIHACSASLIHWCLHLLPASANGTQHRLRWGYSGQVSSSSATRITNMCAKQRPWCTLLLWDCLLLANLKVPTSGSSMLPRTPASSTVSRLAAASSVSSSSQPPFGNTQPPPLDVISMTSVVSGVGAAPGYLMGMHPATSLSPVSPYRCLCLPWRADAGAGPPMRLVVGTLPFGMLST